MPVRGRRRPCEDTVQPWPGHGTVAQACSVPVPNDSGSSRSVIVGLVAVIGSLGGLALLVWITVVMLDLKHLNTSGFTLP
jgi:hypothetical protein